MGAARTKAGREFQRVGAMKLKERSASVVHFCLGITSKPESNCVQGHSGSAGWRDTLDLCDEGPFRQAGEF